MGAVALLEVTPCVGTTELLHVRTTVSESSAGRQLPYPPSTNASGMRHYREAHETPMARNVLRSHGYRRMRCHIHELLLETFDMPETGLPEPGYYPDPFDPTRIRLWLGDRWPEIETDTDDQRREIAKRNVLAPGGVVAPPSDVPAAGITESGVTIRPPRPPVPAPPPRPPRPPKPSRPSIASPEFEPTRRGALRVIMAIVALVAIAGAIAAIVLAESGN